MPPKIRSYAIASVFLALGVPSLSFGQGAGPQKPQDKTVVTTPPVKVDPDKKTEKPKDDETIDYEKFVGSLKRVDGPMALYQKGKSIYLELPQDKLGKIFLIQAAFDTGLDTMFMHAGMPIGSNAIDAFKFERKDDMVWLTRPNISNRWSDDSTFKIGAQRTFPDAMLNTFRVEQENTDKKLLLVNITSLFYGDVFHLGEMIAGGLGGPYQLDPTRSGPESVHGYPENTVVHMKLHYASPRGSEPNPIMALLGLSGNTLEDDRSAPVQIAYSMWWRNPSDYVARVADPRIGYFTTDFYSVDKFLDQDKQEHFIDRFNLKKKDPKAALSEPVKPIMWTIDPSIPEKYRPAIKAGVLRWNKAFEALGYKNAMQVQDVPKSDTNYDHADGRYNVIRMLVGPEAPFAAISLLRTDPLSGEILNASITLDGNVLQTLMTEHEHNLPIATTTQLNRAQQVLLRDSSRTMTDDRYLFETPQDQVVDKAEQRMAKFGWTHDLCSFSSEMAVQSQLSWDALQLAPGGSNMSQEAYVDSYLSEAVCHEVGHCLGLRHNFAGSTEFTTKQLGDDKLTAAEGTTASVMDYTPPNAPAVLKGRGEIFMGTVGTYDKWAIKYGYMNTGSTTSLGEKYQLSQVANQSGLPGHTYLTDEDADQFDPDGVRFDCAKDPLNFSMDQLLELRRARQYAIEDLPKNGESYDERTKVVLGTIIRSFNEGRIAARFVGGTFGTKNFKGDQGERATLQPVPPSTQRQAMHLITTQFLAPDNFDLPTSVMERLSLDGSGESEEGATWNAPLRELLSSLEQNMLAMTMSASTTDRVAENAYKTHDKDAYTLDEHYNLLLHSVCSEIGTNQSISPLRRDLQRFYMQALMLQAGAPEGSVSNDVRLVANDSLQRLNTVIGTQLAHPASLDNMTRLHLKECRDGISRFLNRKLSSSR